MQFPQTILLLLASTLLLSTNAAPGPKKTGVTRYTTRYARPVHTSLPLKKSHTSAKLPKTRVPAKPHGAVNGGGNLVNSKHDGECKVDDQKCHDGDDSSSCDIYNQCTSDYNKCSWEGSSWATCN